MKTKSYSYRKKRLIVLCSVRQAVDNRPSLTTDVCTTTGTGTIITSLN